MRLVAVSEKWPNLLPRRMFICREIIDLSRSITDSRCIRSQPHPFTPKAGWAPV